MGADVVLKATKVMPDKINNTSHSEDENQTPNANGGNFSVNNTNQGMQSEQDKDSMSDNDSYKKSMTGYDSTKQDVNFTGTEKTASQNSIDERDPNDGDANQENNY